MATKTATRSPLPTSIRSSGTIYLPNKSSSTLGEPSSSKRPDVLVSKCITALANHIGAVRQFFENRDGGKEWPLSGKSDTIWRLQSIGHALEVLAQLARSVEHPQGYPKTHLAAFELFCQHDGPLEGCVAELQSLKRRVEGRDESIHRIQDERGVRSWNERTTLDAERVIRKQLDRFETILEIGMMADQE